jgi:hypothetical protein
MAKISSRKTIAAMLPITSPRRRRISAIQRSAFEGMAKRRGDASRVVGLSSAGWSAIHLMISGK